MEDEEDYEIVTAPTDVVLEIARRNSERWAITLQILADN